MSGSHESADGVRGGASDGSSTGVSGSRVNAGADAGTRLAVYFVPGDDTALARFGHAVLGRDAGARDVARLPGLPTVPEAWTAKPARYGFHATLKAPFHLARDVTEDDLVEACAALARAHAPCPLDGLAVRRPSGFAALVQPGPDAAVDALAADAVVGLEAFRAPLDAAALARRRPETLAPAARARLERWGYPHVLEGFRFHMTLSAALSGSAGGGELDRDPDTVPGTRTATDAGADAAAGGAAALADAWVAALAARFAEAVPETPVLDRFALCRQAAPDAPFVRVAEFPLTG